MKTKLLIITLPLFVYAQTPQPDLQWVDKEVAAIKPPRKGMNPSSVDRIRDPFAAQLALYQPPVTEGKNVVKNPAAHVQTGSLLLQAVFNGKSAMIDGKWYKVDQKVYGYTVSKIDHNSVLLRKKKKKLKLTLITKNDKIKINAK